MQSESKAKSPKPAFNSHDQDAAMQRFEGIMEDYRVATLEVDGTKLSVLGERLEVWATSDMPRIHKVEYLRLINRALRSHQRRCHLISSIIAEGTGLRDRSTYAARGKPTAEEVRPRLVESWG